MSERTALRRIRLVCATASGCLLLAGCVHATKAHFTQHYDLGTPSNVASVPAATQGGAVLRIARFSVPNWLADTAMHYRLDYRDGHRLAAYANADWTAPPASLVETTLQRALAASGDWRAVIGPGVQATSDASLNIRLDNFCQLFSLPDASASVIDATATLTDNHDRVIAQRHFHVTVGAPTPDARGGAAALSQAAHQFADQVHAWLRHTSTP